MQEMSRIKTIAAPTHFIQLLRVLWDREARHCMSFPPTFKLEERHPLSPSLCMVVVGSSERGDQFLYLFIWSCWVACKTCYLQETVSSA